MIKKNGFSKKRNISIALLVFFIFFTDTLYASRINPKVLKSINFATVAAVQPSAAAAAPATTAHVAVMPPVVEEETAADADDEKEEKDTSLPDDTEELADRLKTVLSKNAASVDGAVVTASTAGAVATEAAAAIPKREGGEEKKKDDKKTPKARKYRDTTKQAVRDGREYVFERAESDATNSSSPVTDDDSSDYLDDAEGEWYSGETINALIDYYFGQAPSADHRDTQDLGLGRMHAINIEALDGEVFRNNLIQREREIIRQAADVPQLLIPVNIGVGEGNHWTGLYIRRVPDEDGVINIFYFDPFGNQMPDRLQNILRNVYENRGTVNFYQNNYQYQEDGYNCGPWVIEFFRNFVRFMNEEEVVVVTLFPEGFDIEEARTNHMSALTPHPSVVEDSAAAAAISPAPASVGRVTARAATSSP